LHRDNDRAILIHHGRQLAAEIPDAHFKILSGNHHPPWYGRSDEVINEVLERYPGKVGELNKAAMERAVQEAKIG